MATEHVKVFEEKKSFPIWAWLLPLLLLLALLAWFLMHRHADTTAGTPVTTPAATQQGNNGTAPVLGAIPFDTDQATLTSEGTETLTRAADYMKQNPKSTLRIAGYTDSTGTDPHNQSLSYRRALAAGQFLESRGIDKSRLSGAGFAASNPVDTNATPDGKADNRRVELFLQQ